MTAASTSFGPVTNPYAMITGLTSGTLYYFRVVANNIGGSSAVSLFEAGALTATTAPGMSLPGMHVDISAGQGNNSNYGYSGVVLDHTNRKLLAITLNAANNSKPSLFRCNLDGSNCSHTDISVGQGISSGNQPSATLDHINGKFLVVTSNGSNNNKPSLFRCNLDGTGCTHTDISAGQGTDSGKFPILVLDHINGKFLVVTFNGSNNNKPSLFRCNLDGTGCTHTDISAGQGTGSVVNHPSAVVLDHANGKLLVVINNGSNNSKPSLFRCNLDGTGCTHTDISAGQGTGSGGQPSVVIDHTNGKFLVVTANGANNGTPSLFKCNLDGTGCTHTDISAGKVGSIGLYPNALLDQINGKLLVITKNNTTGERLALFRCNLDGSSCSYADIWAGQGQWTGLYPRAILDSVNGKVIVVTRNDANSAKPSLFIW